MTLSRWTSWKMWMLVVPLALSVPGMAGAVPAKSRGIVFVADGAAGQGFIDDRIANLINNAGLPLNVQQVNWSTLHEPTDFQSHYNFAVKSRQLAHRIIECRKANANVKIYLVGFGAGTTVVLKAAECLPINTVTHIILLAPTVSCYYDLRPALVASAEGIDSFYSPNDDALRCAIKKFGTTDVSVRGATNAAGLSGFYALSNARCDQAIYSRLRQHRLTDNSHPQSRGGHIGYSWPGFLRSQVVAIIEASLLNPRAYPVYPIPQNPPAPTPPVPAPQTPPPPASEPAPVPNIPAPSLPAPQYPPPPAPAPQYPPVIPAAQYQPSARPAIYQSPRP